MSKVISLKKGVDGLDLGFEAAVFAEIAVSVEVDPAACKLLQQKRHWMTCRTKHGNCLAAGDALPPSMQQQRQQRQR